MNLKKYIVTKRNFVEFATSDLHYDEQLREHANETYCYYRGSRYPPEDENQYQPTSLYWQHLAIRALYFIILEVRVNQQFLVFHTVVF